MACSSYDLFDPRTRITDSSPVEGCDHGDFGFAFDNSNFSDRVLRIYIFSWSLQSTPSPSEVRVKTLHISSPILAGRSTFFLKLFSNGMKESQQCHATLRIIASEEAAVMELLKFMYTNTLTVTTAPFVLDVLVAADKFDVPSCVIHCGRLLRNLTMTPECVLDYLNLPSSIITTKAFQSLTVAAKQFYSVRYKDITKFQDEILGLSLADLEAIISSDDIRVAFEDAVYDFVLKWVRARYPKLLDRREILKTRLAKYIRYPYMTAPKLSQDVLTCKEFDNTFAQQVVTEARSFKTRHPLIQHSYTSDESTNHRFVERAYTYRPIIMFTYKQPHPHLVVYMDLKLDRCVGLFPSGNIRSVTFIMCGHQGLYLQAQRRMDRQGSSGYFTLFLVILEKKAVYFGLDYEFAIWLKTANEYVRQFNGHYACKGHEETPRKVCLFSILWTSFIGEYNVFFINNVVRFRIKFRETDIKQFIYSIN